MPDSINILGLTYKIIEVDVVNKEMYRAGEINFVEQVIRIDKTLTNQRKEITLMHEIIHGICEQMQYDDIGENEKVVQGFAIALHQILNSGFTFSS